MPAREIHIKPVLVAAAVYALVVAGAIVVTLALLALWREPFGGLPSEGAAVRRAIASRGPVLQTAPQDDLAAYRALKARQFAASEVRR